jgi:hypothetical protein
MAIGMPNIVGGIRCANFSYKLFSIKSMNSFMSINLIWTKDARLPPFFPLMVGAVGENLGF